MSKSSLSKQKQTSSKNEMEKYEVLKLLGEGSFGRVYKAKVIADSSFVALKIICKARRSNKEIIGLRRECEIQRHLHHPNIIQMLDSFETPSEIVVVTEFAHKELNTLLGKEGYLSEERAGSIIWDLVSALYYLHSHRVLHRDLKPQNVLIDTRNHAKLCDFGFARNMSTGTHVLTSIKGTPLYMAPELIEEQPYDYKADLWSLGCIMYELLMGAPPFCTASILHLIRLIRFEQIQWPTFVSSNCISFLKGLLQKDPGKRITWEEILSHDFVKGHILICSESSSNMPLTQPLTESTLQAKEQQISKIINKTDDDEKDMKNNNVSQESSKINFIEENHPIETEEWIVFLQKTIEEVIGGEMTSLTQPHLTNIVVSPLRNTNTSPKVLAYVAKLLSIPFALRGVNQETKNSIKKVYLEVKLIPNLIYSSKQIMKVRNKNEDSNSSLPATFKDISDLTDDDLHSLEHIFMLATHLVHLDNEFLSQFCDAIAILNVCTILKNVLFICKNKQISMDLLAILTHILRIYPENLELIDKILFCEDKILNFVDLLRHNNPTMQERACFFLLFLGKYLSNNKMEILWNKTVRETLEALMYDSIENVRNAADRTVEELRYKEFYKISKII